MPGKARLKVMLGPVWYKKSLEKQPESVFKDMLQVYRLMCVMFDEAIREDNRWYTIGRTQDGTSLVIREHDGREAGEAIYFGSLEELADKCKPWLEQS